MTPEGWQRALLDQTAASITVGHVGSTGEHYTDPDNGVLFLRTGNVASGRITLDDLKYVTREFHERLRKSAIRPGDVLISRVGQTGNAALVPPDFPEANCANIIIIRPGPSVTADYLQRFVNGPAASRQSRSLSAGSVQSVLNIGAIKNMEILLPPLGEQQKIAAILSSVDEAIEATHAVIDQLQLLKKAILAELLMQGLPGRHTRFKQTEIGEVPEEWEVRRAGELCSVITKGATPAAQTRDSGEVPFLKVYNLDPRGFIDFSYQPSFIPKEVHTGELARSRVEPGDVLMNIVGPPLGKVAVVPEGFGHANINQAIAVFRPTGVEPHFLEACLREATLFSWALSRAKRTSTQLNLTLELCRDYPLPLPPIEERRGILAMVVAGDKRLRAEEAYLEQLRLTKAALMSVLLTGEVRVKPDEEAA